MSDAEWLGASDDEAAFLEGQFQADQERAWEEAQAHAAAEHDAAAALVAPPPARIVPFPGTGEVIPLDDPAACADALERLRTMDRQIGEIKRLVTSALADRSKVEGRKTFRLPDGRTVTIGGGSERRVDPDRLARGLREAGMTEARIKEIVVETVSRKVDLRAADQAAKANPEYKAALEAATTTEEKSWNATIK